MEPHKSTWEVLLKTYPDGLRGGKETAAGANQVRKVDGAYLGTASMWFPKRQNLLADLRGDFQLSESFEGSRPLQQEIVHEFNDQYFAVGN